MRFDRKSDVAGRLAKLAESLLKKGGSWACLVFGTTGGRGGERMFAFASAKIRLVESPELVPRAFHRAHHRRCCLHL